MAHVDRKRLQQYVEKGLVTEQKHPVSDLYIYNYTPVVQFGKLWDEVTMACRGLITNAAGHVVAQPFIKFFNYGEYAGQLPEGEFIVSEKLDGSLGICYPHKGVLSIATRGSFVSEQAQEGDKMLQEYIKKHGLDWYDECYTYLFEIIYPANRIVVDYGAERRLVLLAVINTNYGTELNPHDTGYLDCAQRLPQSTPIEDLLLHQQPNQEGYVLRFGNGMRLKVKFDEYVRLHRIITRVQPKDVWELLRTGANLNEFLDSVPDEFYKWVHKIKGELEQKYAGHVANAEAAYADMQQYGSRKEQAAALQAYEQPVRAAVFARLDGKDWQPIIWKAIKPKFEKPFKEDIDG